MKNRYNDEYKFEQVKDKVYKLVGDLKHWRYGGKEGIPGVDVDDLGFADPSGGPYMEVDGAVFVDPITKKIIKKIWVEGKDLYLEVK